MAKKKKNTKPSSSQKTAKTKRPIRKASKRLRYKGRFISYDLEDKIKDLRKQKVKEGKFVSYKSLVNEYYSVQDRLRQQEEKEIERLQVDDEIKDAYDYNTYLWNQIVDALTSEYIRTPDAAIYVRRIGSDQDIRETYSEAVYTIQKQLSALWEAVGYYDKIYQRVQSPIFFIPMLVDRLQKRIVIDFNEIEAPSMNVNQLLNYAKMFGS